LYVGGSPPVAFARTDHSGRPIPRRHPLTLIVFPATLARANASGLTGCVYLHAYLVFKEPTWCAGDAPPTSAAELDSLHRPLDAGLICCPSHRSGLGRKGPAACRVRRV
jgi:hypothetical protein